MKHPIKRERLDLTGVTDVGAAAGWLVKDRSEKAPRRSMCILFIGNPFFRNDYVWWRNYEQESHQSLCWLTKVTIISRKLEAASLRRTRFPLASIRISIPDAGRYLRPRNSEPWNVLWKLVQSGRCGRVARSYFGTFRYRFCFSPHRCFKFASNYFGR